MENPRTIVVMFDWYNGFMFDQHLPYATAFAATLDALIYLKEPSSDQFLHVLNLKVKEHCPYINGLPVRNLYSFVQNTHRMVWEKLGNPTMCAITTRYVITERDIVFYVTDHFQDLRAIQ